MLIPNIAKLDRAGFPVPAKTEAVIAAYNAVVSDDREQSAFNACAAAIAAGDTAAALAAADAYAVSRLEDRNHMHSELTDVIDRAIRASYPAEEAWAFAARTFTDAAKRFNAAFAIVDPDTRADAVVKMTAPKREAWTRYPEIVAELEHGLSLMVAAANVVAPGFSNRSTSVLPLAVDVAPASLKAVLDAFELKGRALTSRAGRWAPVVRSGGKLRAAALKDLTRTA